MNKKDISIQLYTARNFQPYSSILNFFSESGITNIELFGLESLNIVDFKEMMESSNHSRTIAIMREMKFCSFNVLERY